MQSTWPATQHNETFAEVVARREAEFSAFLKPLPAALPGHEQTRALAGYILWSCLAPPRGIVVRPVMLMSKHGMPRVWSWDHCFNAVALAGSHPDMAWHQFQAFVEHQDADGCYPDSCTPVRSEWEYCSRPSTAGPCADDRVRGSWHGPSERGLRAAGPLDALVAECARSGWRWAP